MAGSYDIFAGTNPITGVNNFKVDHNPLEEITYGFEDMQRQLDNIDWAAIIENWFKTVLIPLIKKMLHLDLSGFKKFFDSLIAAIYAHTGLDLSSPHHLFESIKHLIQQHVFDINTWWKELIARVELSTGLNLDEGVVKFLQSLNAVLKKHRLDWITQFEDATGLNIDEGVVKFLQSFIASLKQHHLDWVTQFEAATGLNVDEGAVKFLQSLIAALKQHHLDWVSDFESKTGLNIDEGARKFIESWQAVAKQNRLDWISEFEDKTNLDIDNGAAAFFQSVRDLLRPEWQKDGVNWIPDFEARTGLDIDNGAAAFFQSLVQQLQPDFAGKDEWVTDFETRTGLNIDAGGQAFFESVRDLLRPEWQVDDDNWIADFEARTGLDVDAGASAFLTSLLAKLKPEWAKDTTPLGDKLQDLINGIGGVDSAAAAPAGGRPLQEALDAILGLRDKADLAQASADRANMDIAVLIAAQNGGFSDEFDYPDAKELPNNAASPLPSWAVTYETKMLGGNNVLTWGPDGKGLCVWKANGIAGTGVRTVIYREKNHPQAGATGTLTLQFSKPVTRATAAEAYACWHMSATDKSCNRVAITYNKIQLQSVDAAGTVTDVGGAVTIPNLEEGTTFVVKYTATQVEVLRNKIPDLKVAYTPKAGQYIGFGAYSPTFLGVGAINPNASYKGIAFHP